MNRSSDGFAVCCDVDGCGWSTVRSTRVAVLCVAKGHWIETGHSVTVDEQEGP
jgi:hypothetical protein